MKNIGVLIYTYNRIDDAKINMEIIRNIWEKSGYFQDVKILHSFNGKKELYTEKYLENDLIISKNTWHFQGASDLIDVGMRVFKKYKNLDYVIVLAADTWLIDPKYIEKILSKMQKDKLYFATCPWGLPARNKIADVGVAVDFFIIDIKWANKYKMFPIDYGKFQKKYEDFFAYIKAGNVMLEKLLLARYLKAISRSENIGGIARKIASKKLLVLKEREPVHSGIKKDGTWARNMYWPKIGLLTHHEPLPKKKILKAKNVKEGGNIKKLLESKNLSYYNNGITRMKYNCN